MWWRIGSDLENWAVLHFAAMALFWAITLLFLGFVALRPRPVTPAENNADTNQGGILSARTILEEQYAKGEISRKEFLNKMRDLEVAAFRGEAVAQAQELP